MSDSFNPFRILHSVQRGELEPGEAAEQLNVTNRVVLGRLARYAKHFDILIWAYDEIVAKQVPHRSLRTSMMESLSARLGISKRQILRLLTEFEAFKPTLYVNRAQEAHERRVNHLAHLEDLAARVLSSETTVSQLLETRQTDGTSRAGLYRAVKRLADEIAIDPRDVPRMSRTAQERLAARIRQHLKEKRRDEAVRNARSASGSPATA